MARLQLLLIPLALSAVATAQTTWHVDVDGTPPGSGTPGDPYTSIQYALDQPSTATGDTLLVHAGVYVENLLLAKRVLLRAAEGPDATTLRAARPGTLVRVTADDLGPPQATIDGFTLDGGADPAGTGIQVQNGGGNLTMVGCILRDNGVAVTPPEGLQVGFHPAYSCLPFDLVAGQPPGTNIGARPGFWSVAHGDLHLAPGSPCIDAAGTASVSGASGMTVSAQDVLSDKLGIAFYGFEPQAAPFQGGTLCVGGTTQRMPPQGSGGNPPPDDCSGAFQVDFGAWLVAGSDPMLVPGALVYLQFWYRDPADPGGFGSALSDAVGFGIAP